MRASFNGVFVGAEPEQKIEKDGNNFRVVNCTFQEIDENGFPLHGQYQIVEFWNGNIDSLSGVRIGDKKRLDVEVITRRKHNRPERYRTRITLEKMESIEDGY